MKNDIFWVDAFSAEPFGGNPAVVCVGTDGLSDAQLQHLANEFNVSESVFIAGGDGEYSIRWFTPTKELASLATRRSRRLTWCCLFWNRIGQRCNLSPR